MAMKSFNLIKEPREIYINSANMFYEALLERYAYKYELPPTIKEECKLFDSSFKLNLKI